MVQGPGEERAAERNLWKSIKEYAWPSIKLDLCRARFCEPSLRITVFQKYQIQGNGGVPTIPTGRTTLDAKHL